MALMPRGEPRSVPDPDGEDYDREMMRQRPLEEARSDVTLATPWPSSIPETGFSAARRFDFLNQPPRPSSTVTIGGRTYRDVDDGHANRLVPVDDPSISPAELVERRRAILRAQFMASHPLGSSAYGLAALMGASPGARDGALAAGSVADAAMTGVARPIEQPAGWRK
jgi:hypothetical protein